MGKVTGSLECFDEMCRQVDEYLAHHALGASLTLMDGILKYAGLAQYNSELQTLRQTYDWMIQYMAEGTPDPARSQIYQQLLLRFYALFDDVRRTYHTVASSSYYYEQLRVAKLDAGGALRLCRSQRLSQFSETQAIDFTRNVFNAFLSTPSMDASICDEAVAYITGAEEDEADVLCCLMVSALTLSLLEVFDEAKIMLLIRIYDHNEVAEKVRVRALAGVFFALIRYERRLSLYPAVKNALHVRPDRWEKDIRAMQLQLLLTQETKQIARKMSEDILPEMLKQSAAWRGRITSADPFKALDETEFNPLWTENEAFRKIENKLRALSEMQQKGADVYWGTFSALKRHYPFYKTISNWFLPFCPNHPVLRGLQFQKGFVTRFLQAPFFCDSDKYSFCLMFRDIPEAQRSLLEGKLTAPIEQSDDWATGGFEELLRHYLQDLYRFYTLSPCVGQLYSPFSLDRLPVSNVWLHTWLGRREALEEAAEWTFSQRNFKVAVQYYDCLASQYGETAEMLQKKGYCLQQEGEYGKAAESYEKSALLLPHAWTTERLAQCYLHSSDYARAQRLLHDLNAVERPRLRNLFAESHCLLQLNQPKVALEVLYRALYLAVEPDDIKQARRAIAWSLFLTGDLEQAESQYHKFSLTTAEDYMNFGHVQWARGNEHEALLSYCKSAGISGLKEVDTHFFDADACHLEEHAITHDAMMMMTDAINYLLKHSLSTE